MRDASPKDYIPTRPGHVPNTPAQPAANMDDKQKLRDRADTINQQITELQILDARMAKAFASCASAMQSLTDATTQLSKDGQLKSLQLLRDVVGHLHTAMTELGTGENDDDTPKHEHLYELKQRRDALRDEIAQLEPSAAALREEHETARAQLSKLNADVAQHRAALAELHVTKKQHDAELAQMRKDKDARDAELARLRSDKQSLESDLAQAASVRTELADLTQRRDEAASIAAEQGRICGTLAPVLATIDAAADQLNEAMQRLTRQHQGMKNCEHHLVLARWVAWSQRLLMHRINVQWAEAQARQGLMNKMKVRCAKMTEDLRHVLRGCVRRSMLGGGGGLAQPRRVRGLRMRGRAGQGGEECERELGGLNWQGCAMQDVGGRRLRLWSRGRETWQRAEMEKRMHACEGAVREIQGRISQAELGLREVVGAALCA